MNGNLHDEAIATAAVGETRDAVRPGVGGKSVVKTQSGPRPAPGKLTTNDTVRGTKDTVQGTIRTPDRTRRLVGGEHFRIVHLEPLAMTPEMVVVFDESSHPVWFEPEAVASVSLAHKARRKG